MHLIGLYIWTTKKLSNIYTNYLNYRNIVGGIIDYDFNVNEDAIEIEMTRPVVPSKGKKMWSLGNWAAQ